jgi:hypothetical protein
MSVISKISFIDISDRETRARDQLKSDIAHLVERKNNRKTLSAADDAELKRLQDIQAANPKSFDPLLATTAAAFADPNSELRPLDVSINRTTGQLTVTPIGARPASSAGRSKGAAPEATVARVALVLGLLQLNKAPVPPLLVTKGVVQPDHGHPNAPLFAEAFYRAVGRASGNLNLATRVLGLIGDALDISGSGNDAKVSSLEFAKVIEKLIAQGVQASDPNLKRHVDGRLDQVQAIGEDDKPQHEIGIRLPDLEATTDHQVIEDNIRLIGPMIFASMFDELKAFQVVDRLIEMSQRGELPLVKGKAGTQLYNYWRQAPNRMSETERQTFYAITLGLPTGPPGVTVNKDFPDLWIRFVSSASALVRERRVDQLIRSSLPYAINQQQVKKAARDLAANMSLYGYGMAYYAAVDLQAQINEMIELLQDEELKKAFGARDMWGVIDQVATTELGGARNSSKYRMLATSGAIITTWLANNLDRLRDATRAMIDLRDVENAPSRPRGQTAATHPTDYDLVNACEMWLADSALDDERVEVLSQPRESPQQTSRPVQIPSFARDLLEGAGLGFEMGAVSRQAGRGNGRANGRAAQYPGF